MVLKVVIMKARGNLGPKRSLHNGKGRKGARAYVY